MARVAGLLALSALAVLLTPVPAAAASATSASRLGPCAQGTLCLWGKSEFRGARQSFELSDVDIESCVPLPAGTSAVAVANRTGRPVTLYQSAECAETGELVTHPSGSWTPESPYRARAFKIWEN
ncbi:peptidase inhibitor family I36 protein [Streptomyces sp. AJS327]|uniref:peptidase inhibitor family I36 protein n=1 Tax=Streptomyces sp. AJS327 TaxID=2545265 RepID=UPI0035B55893